MKKWVRFAAVFFLMFSSCTSLRYIDLQVLEPGSVKLPKNLDAINIIVPDLTHLDHTIVMEDTVYSYQEYYNLFIQVFDSTLRVVLEKSPALDKTEIYIESERKFHEKINRIPSSQRSRQSAIRIEKLIITDTIKPNTEIAEQDYGFSYYSFYSLYSRLRINFNNINNKYIDAYIFSDTLTWVGKGNYSYEAKSKIPSTKEAIIELAIYSADEYGKWVAPYWITQERILFFNGNKYMRQGYNHFLNDDLNKALEIWQYVYSAGTPKLASMAAHNIAVVYEIQDELNSCELWLKNSVKAKYSQVTDNYLFIISQRLKLQKKLETQIMK